MCSNIIFRNDWPIKSSQSNLDLWSPDCYWVRSYLITTVQCNLDLFINIKFSDHCWMQWSTNGFKNRKYWANWIQNVSSSSKYIHDNVFYESLQSMFRMALVKAIEVLASVGNKNKMNKVGKQASKQTNSTPFF